MDKTNCRDEATRLPRVCSYRGDGVAFGIQRTTTQFTSGISLEDGNLAAPTIDAAQPATPLSGIESDEEFIRRPVS